MDNATQKERYLGSREDGIGWKIYAIVPFFLAGLGIYLLANTSNLRIKENQFLNSQTTLTTNGTVTALKAEYFSSSINRPDIHAVEASRVGGAIMTKLRQSGRSYDFDRAEHDKLHIISIVSFTDSEGMPHTFEGARGDNGARHVPGDQVQVIYDSTNPSKAILPAQKHSGSILSAVFGGICLMIAAVLFFGNRKRKAKRNKLFSKGIVVKAVINDVIIDKKTKANDEYPLRLVASWDDKDHSVTHEFTSEHIWEDYDHTLIDEEVAVVVVPDETDIYHVDTDFIKYRRRAA